MTITTRPITPEDADDVARMSDALTEIEGLPSGRFTAEAYRRDGFGPDRAFDGLVAEVEGTIAGYLLFQPFYDAVEGRRGLYMLDLYVEAPFRRRSVGRTLMQALAGVAASRGAEWLAWGVMQDNTPAVRFYEAVGAERDNHVTMVVDADKLR